ncbi:MAG: winged helix-turn-helix domain-containing protein [Epsilonproteobacteria bacterium]|nr:winged helix-turn-helix domain-containing protein [Campylobacterota bacterium]
MIIFLTAYSDKEMIDFAVESNAFAYLLKPYRDKEILATLELAKAKLNTKDINQSDKRMSSRVELVSGYIFDTQLNRLFLHNEEVPLGNKALKLMQLLCQNRHITMEIESITNMLWEEPKSGQTLRSLIHRIREATCYDLIQNINKFGYKIGLKRA